MDIQGTELKALQGALKKLSQHAISLLYTEVWFVAVYKDAPFFYELYQFLSDYGYVLYDVYNLNYTAKGQLKWGDAIFLNPEVLS